MAKFFLGLTVGLVVGAVVAAALSPGQKLTTRSVSVDPQKQREFQEYSKKIEALQQEKLEAETKLHEALDNAGNLSQKIAELKEQLAEAKQETAKLQPKDEIPTKEHAEPEKPQVSEPTPEQEIAKLTLKTIERYQRILRVGAPLSEKALEELGVDEATAARINEVLKDEAVRANKALAEFCLANLSEVPENLMELSPEDLIFKLIPEIKDEMSKFAQLSVEERLKLAKGEKDLLDYLPRDSKLMTLGHTLYKVRQETYRQVERDLPPEKMNIFREKYLPPNDFIFPGNLNFLFGKIDWDKER